MPMGVRGLGFAYFAGVKLVGPTAAAQELRLTGERQAGAARIGALVTPGGAGVC